MLEAEKQIEQNRRVRSGTNGASKQYPEKCFWTPEMKDVRKRLRKAQKRDMRGTERRRLGCELTNLIELRTIQMAARNYVNASIPKDQLIKPLL